MMTQKIDERLRGTIVKLIIELEYANEKLGMDRSLTRALTIRDARKIIGWKSVEQAA